MDSWYRLLALAFTAACLLAGESSGPPAGILLLDGGGTSEPVVREFVRRSGGADARIVVFPTGASSLRFGVGNVILDPDWPLDRPEWAAYHAYLRQWFRTEHITILHTRDRTVADSEEFVRPLLQATGVFLSSGNAGRHASAYLGTRTQKELEAVLARGGIIFGSSAGAIIQGSFVVRGRPDKPLLMAPGRTQGFGFLKNVAINPHLTSAKRDTELIYVCDQNPGLLGLGIDDEAALLVEGNRFQVVGTGRVAVYDDQRHSGSWYYWLTPGSRFDLASWKKLP